MKVKICAAFMGLFFMSVAVSPAQKTQKKPIPKQSIQEPLGATTIDKSRLAVLGRIHFHSIHFYGSGSTSRYGYTPQQPGAPYDLWLELRNRGKVPWANVVLRLRRPYNITPYNAIAIWIRSSRPGLRLWMGLHDATWTDKERPQARTDVIPTAGLLNQQFVQLIIPLSKIYSEAPFDATQVSQITFEYGSDTVGNPQNSTIYVAGIAFLADAVSPTRVRMWTQNSRVARIYPLPSQALDPSFNRGKLPKGIEPAPLASQKRPAADPSSQILLMPDAPAALTFVQQGIRIRKSNAPSTLPPAKMEPQKIDPDTIPKKDSPRSVKDALAWKDQISHHYRAKFNRLGKAARYWRARVQLLQSDAFLLYVNAVEVLPFFGRTPSRYAILSSPLFKDKGGASFFTEFPISVSGQSLILMFVFAIWMTRRRTKLSAMYPLQNAVRQVLWPPSPAKRPKRRESDRQFWRQMGAKRVRHAWLSPFQVSLKRRSEEDHYGEGFLKRQIMLARRENVFVYPSLCFVRTVFYHQAFFTNPRLYLTKPIPHADRHLSDEQLRTKHIGYFPIWLPPSRQREHNLPQRLLVAYGKIPGQIASHDSIQYDISSKELRDMASRVIERFVAITEGVRVEGAAFMLNSNLKKFGLHPSQPAETPQREFWPEIISSIKTKFPSFVFVADSVGADYKAICDMGFDFFENDHLRDVLLNQIRLELVGRLPKLIQEMEPYLSRSIYNAVPLLHQEQPMGLINLQKRLTLALLSMMPGIMQYDGNWPEDLDGFFDWRQTLPVLRKGAFAMLETGSPSCFAFARWIGRSLYIFVANFSVNANETYIRFDALLPSIDKSKLFLFSDAWYGAAFSRSLPTETKGGPVTAVLGKDLSEMGLPVSLSGLSMRAFHITFPRAIPNGVSPKIQHVHKA